MFQTKYLSSWRRLHTCLRLSKRVDYYEALGVNKTCDAKSIKVAYFRLAKKYHPDFNPSVTAAPMFEMISEAYEVLSDPQKRKNYDDFGTAGHSFGGTTSGPGRKRGDKTHSSKDLMEIFKKSGQNTKSLDDDEGDFETTFYGFDATSDFIVTLTFEEAARGCIYERVVNQKCICYKCEGSRSDLGFQGKSCPYCEGTGVETEKVLSNAKLVHNDVNLIPRYFSRLVT